MAEEVKQQEQQQEEQPQQRIECGIVVVLLENGDMSVQFLGERQNLITLDGLLKYAERYLDNQWKPRMKTAE